MLESNRISIKTLLLILLLLFGSLQLLANSAELNVYAAASTTGPLMEIAQAFEKETGIKIKTSFASSGVLARQIEQGAEADIYISASKKWADYTEEKDLLIPSTRKNFLTNTLVFITPKGSPSAVKIVFSPDFDLPAELKSRLSIGNPEFVPAGRYAKEAMSHFNWWEGFQGNKRLILSKDVRAALRVVETGEAELGVVYGSDAKTSDKVILAATFPKDSHKPIIYVIAAVKGGSEDAGKFIDYIFSAQASAIFKNFSFIPLPKE